MIAVPGSLGQEYHEFDVSLSCMQGCAVFKHRHRLELGDNEHHTQCVHIHMEARLQYEMSSSVALHLFCETGSLTEPESLIQLD